MESPYKNLPVENWKSKTEELINKHPLKNKIVEIVLKSWDDIFKSKVGSFTIGKEITPSPQIMSFFLHELVAHYLSLEYPKEYKVGESKTEKDIHNMKKPELGIEIKASSNRTQIFANRSYAQPSSQSEEKDKNGYYIGINFEKFTKTNRTPQILQIRFGYLEHSDWIAQKSETGQQARLSPDADKNKFFVLYKKKCD
ncbi:MAG: ScaI family restriction endonuclease [Alphaproteobacteria bacterium]|nr:ScaI family restriction endonuclease [Alphaproteobacteria bacterium]